MLGELLGRLTVQVVEQRVLLPGESASPRVEASSQGSGRLLDLDVRVIFTSVVAYRPDRSLFTDARGLITTSDGETVSSTGQGVGHFVGSGLASSWARRRVFLDGFSETDPPQQHCRRHRTGSG